MSKLPEKEHYKSAGAYLIGEERQRQVEVEGWKPSHDLVYHGAQLARAATEYCVEASNQLRPDYSAGGPDRVPGGWPWQDEWWKPEGPMRTLVKAGALVAAEIDRLNLLYQQAVNRITQRDFGFEAFDEDDTYDLLNADWREWVDGDPQDFADEFFCEDYARLDMDADLARQGELAAAEENHCPEGDDGEEE